MTTNHTQAPWRSNEDAAIIAGVGNYAIGVAYTLDNAAHIVRCVNSHDALVDALRDVIAAAEGGTNGRNVTAETRRAECAAIARAALKAATE